MHTKDNYNNNIIEALSSYIYLDNSDFENYKLTEYLTENYLSEYTDDETFRNIIWK